MTRRSLPRSLEDLRGRRAARWLRESTAGQADNFGPDAQREQQDRAIERWGLVDTGIAWEVAHSGRTIATTGQWAQMLAGAGTEWDVLVVGYVSRFARDLRTAVNARHDLHALGASILFADERVLSSDEDEWERWAREAVEAEAYSRRLAKRIREGYAAKRRRLGIPGGNRAPLGTVRTGREIVLDPEQLPTVHRAYELAAAGLTDGDVAAATGLAPKHVAELLTNPFYAGRLRDGSPSALGPIVEVETWEAVQAARARFSRRAPGRPSRHHPYPLSKLLVCAGCGRRLTGHVGRYRHVQACEAFTAARPRVRRRYTNALDGRVRGESYPAAVYDELVPQVLAHVAAGAAERVGVVARATRPEGAAAGDQLGLARIERERNQASDRLTRDRDIAAWEATMRRLDEEEQSAREREAPTPTAAQAAGYLADLPALWRDTDDDGRRLLAQALFERVEALGTERVSFVPTLKAEAYGFAAAWPGPIRCSIGRYGRGERDSASSSYVLVDLLTTPRSWVRTA